MGEESVVGLWGGHPSEMSTPRHSLPGEGCMGREGAYSPGSGLCGQRSLPSLHLTLNTVTSPANPSLGRRLSLDELLCPTFHNSTLSLLHWTWLLLFCFAICAGSARMSACFANI